MKLIWKILGILVLALVVIGAGAFLFFQDFTVKTYNNFVKQWTASKIEEGDILDIAYLFSPASLNPLTNDQVINSRINDIYESLVSVDKDLNIRSQLALRYGVVDQTTYEFKLRPVVKFHNGQILAPEDAIYSFKIAQTDPDSQLKDLLADFVSVTKTEADTIEIKTSKPDPLFLNKVAKVKIVPNEFKDYSKPLGTGPYEIQNSGNLKEIFYLSNEDYWGPKPFFKRVRIVAIPEKGARINGIVNGEFDLLANVPPDSVAELKSKNIMVLTVPSLEIAALMFNLKDKDFSSLNLRKAVAQAINKESLLGLSYNQARTVDQFISAGVFGYDPEIKSLPFDLKSAKENYSKDASVFEKLKVDFYFPASLNLLGGFIKDQLSPVGFELNLKPVTDVELLDVIKSGKAGFYYLGWKNDLADAIFFLKNVVHSKTGAYGQLNGTGLTDKEIDTLIENSEYNLDAAKRLKNMQAVMKKIVQENLIGVPLLETNSIFAVRPDIVFLPRVDSEIYPSQILRK